MPAASAIAAARGSRTRPEFGSVKPTASKSWKSPFASRSPRNRPTTDATTPITRASTMTEPRTCRFVAPIVRSVANSRVRCAIVIDSELAMTNAPTKSAIPPNASRNPRRNEMNSLVSAESAAACADPVLTCAHPAGGSPRSGARAQRPGRRASPRPRSRPAGLPCRRGAALSGGRSLRASRRRSSDRS